jgi:hypothetical protein
MPYGWRYFRFISSGASTAFSRKIASSGMLRPVAFVKTDALEDGIASIIKVTRISEPGTTLAVTSNRNNRRASFASYCYIS